MDAGVGYQVLSSIFGAEILQQSITQATATIASIGDPNIKITPLSKWLLHNSPKVGEH